jgi:tight adherence protein B
MAIQLLAAFLGALTVFVAVGSLTGQFSYSRRRLVNRAVNLTRQEIDATGSAFNPILREDQLAGSEGARNFLRRFTWASKRAELLDRADLPLKVSEYIGIALVLAIGIGFITAVVSGLWWVGLIFGAAAIIGFEYWTKNRAKRRLQRFNEQLPIALQIMSTSLKSGFGIMEAVATVARDMDAPLSEEFSRIVEEARVGGSFEQSMDRLVERMDSTDLRIVVRALEIHRKVGGDLGEILDSVGATMRERDELRGHVRALTAQQRLGGMIVGLLPIWVVGFFLVTQPDFISPLWTDEIGRVLLGAGIVMEAVAFVVMRRVMDIEV